MNCISDMHLDVEHITYIVVYLDNPLYLGRYLYLYAYGARSTECGECGVRGAGCGVRSMSNSSRLYCRSCAHAEASWFNITALLCLAHAEVERFWGFGVEGFRDISRADPDRLMRPSMINDK